MTFTREGDSRRKKEEKRKPVGKRCEVWFSHGRVKKSILRMYTLGVSAGYQGEYIYACI